MKKSSWYVYIIETEKGHLYTGITTDLERRFKEHASGKKGAKYFGVSAPLGILFSKRFKDRSSASKAEAAIKKLKREEKLKIIQTKKFKAPSRKMT
jgi:putative endonuclease